MSMVALLVSLMAPGAGQIFCGNFLQGIIWGTLFALGKSALLPLCLRIFKIKKLKTTLYAFYVWNWIYIFVILVAAFAAFAQAQAVTKNYFLQTVLFILCVRIVKKQTFNSFIFTALCGRSGVWNILLKTSHLPSEK